MTIDLDHPYVQELREYAVVTPELIVPFVGAGLSVPAGLPTWQRLLEALAERARLLGLIDQDRRDTILRQEPVRAGTRLREILTEAQWRDRVTRELTPQPGYTIPQAYQLLWRQLGARGLISTNLDRIAADAYAKVNQRAPLVYVGTDGDALQGLLRATDPWILMLHGDLTRPSTWVLTEDSYSEVTHRNGPLDACLSSITESRILLFLGFSGSDFHITTALRQYCQRWPAARPTHYALLPNPDAETVADLLRLGIYTIPYKPDTNAHDEISRLLLHITEDRALNEARIFPVTTDLLSTTEKLPLSELLSRPDDEQLELLNREFSSYIRDLSKMSPRPDVYSDIFYSRARELMPLLAKIWNVRTGDVLYGREIREPIGEGTFGKVWRAYNYRESREEAVKILHINKYDDFDFANRFRQGVEAFRKLENARTMGVVRFYDALEVPLSIFMEFVPGANLEAYLPSVGGLVDRLEVLRDVCQTVLRAHSLADRVVHRDIKPQNVLIGTGSANVTVSLTDFDLAWFLGAASRSFAGPGGAPSYAAPEQLRGNSERSKLPAADVFSLGMLAYFVLTGEEPAPGIYRAPRFEEVIRRDVTRHTEWRFIPSFLAELVQQSARLEAGARLPLRQLLENVESVIDVLKRDAVKFNSALLLREVKEYLIDQFGVATLEQWDTDTRLRLQFRRMHFTIEQRHSYRLPVIRAVIRRLRTEEDDWGSFRSAMERLRSDIHARAQGWVTSVDSEYLECVKEFEVSEPLSRVNLVHCIGDIQRAGEIASRPTA
jgi:eukaryotic-like serine/threonine-protein kinase